MLSKQQKLTARILAAVALLVLPAVTGAQVQPVRPFAGTSMSGLVDSVIFLINALLVLAAIAATVYIIISGVRYMASQGDERELEQARRSLIYGVIGIIIVLLAVVIVNYFAVAVGGGDGQSGLGAPGANFAPNPRSGPLGP